MKKKFASLLTLLLAVAFLSVGLAYAVEKAPEVGQAATEQATQKETCTKTEMKGTVEEEKGKAVTEMKEIKPEGQTEKKTHE